MFLKYKNAKIVLVLLPSSNTIVIETMCLMVSLHHLNHFCCMAIENDLHLFESNGFVGFLCHPMPPLPSSHNQICIEWLNHQGFCPFPLMRRNPLECGSWNPQNLQQLFKNKFHQWRFFHLRLSFCNLLELIPFHITFVFTLATTFCSNCCKMVVESLKIITFMDWWF